MYPENTVFNNVMAKKKLCVIINPVSGTASKNRIPELIEKILDPTLFESKILYTEYAGHAFQLTKEALDNKTNYIIAAGGDGTVNQIAQTMVHSDAALGIIPLGSGNGLARDLGIPMDVKKAIETIAKEHIMTIDYCKANEYFFFCTCGLGFDAKVSNRFSKEKKRGSISYVKSAISEYINFIPDSYEIVLDNETIIQEEAFLVTCANASQYGNNAFIAPNANIRDGMIDVVIMAPIHPIEVGNVAIQLFTKQINNNSKCTRYRTQKAIIKRNKPGPMHIDGEPVHAGKDISIQTIPSGLHVITPEKGSEMLPIQSQIEDVQLFFREILHRIDILK